MKYGYLGRSNLVVSKVCLGTMHFGKLIGAEESFAIMNRALEMGINFFDTANVYGTPTGRTEEIIGQWLSEDPGRRQQIVLGSKVYQNMVRDRHVPNDERGVSFYKVRQHLDDSLRRLQTDHLDLYQCHHLDRRVTGEEFWDTFEHFTNQGKILYTGTSNFAGWALAKLQMTARQRQHLGLVSEQTMYNLLCRYPELELLPAAEDLGIGVLAYMPLAGGLLGGKKQTVSGTRSSEVSAEYGIPIEQNSQLQAFSSLCQALGEKESVVATAWTLANPAVASAVVGIRSLAHLEDLSRAAELALDTATLEQLDVIFDINHGRPLRRAASPEAYAW